ncbi:MULTISPECIES: lytic transglycosylase domain-containing protein [unclassified Chryseobacterium]|uniref:lytic transglycosylase domain-containing protein n=1 Tax=unclassified Chryseobacterium TaxID=2593645 RepID=UPI00285341A2|nr:lytic transglycosylase domain-containing protein [Chryseobacterium sp. CFS7]MDR4895094.1 lytic transglycosylase domain-containing protein [Chryseobacterium sp. CFS7]
MHFNFLKKTLILSFIAFIPSGLLAQETYIKYNQEYIKSLGEDQDIDENLHLDTFKQRFAFLNENTPLNIDYNDITYSYTKKFLSYKWYSKIIGLSTYYFPLFESKLAQYGMPLELKYLACVESALNPRAGSWAGAKGLWQFMPATGGQYGIKQNDYVNIFYDPVGNTDSAVRYLRDLYKELGDWNLAISAYNCGAGNVRKAIRKAGTKNYWKVRPYLPKETQAYVPSFIAVNYLFNFYKEHNIRPQYFKHSFLDLKMIRIKEPTTLEALGKSFDYNILKFANPQFLTNVVPAGSIVYVR